LYLKSLTHPDRGMSDPLSLKSLTHPDRGMSDPISLKSLTPTLLQV
ncbi:hypothetical protein AVEN_120772-1, partial [Araneus ventricosus]